MKRCRGFRGRISKVPSCCSLGFCFRILRRTASSETAPLAPLALPSDAVDAVGSTYLLSLSNSCSASACPTCLLPFGRQIQES